MHEKGFLLEILDRAEVVVRKGRRPAREIPDGS